MLGVMVFVEVGAGGEVYFVRGVATSCVAGGVRLGRCMEWIEYQDWCMTCWPVVLLAG